MKVRTCIREAALSILRPVVESRPESEAFMNFRAPLAVRISIAKSMPTKVLMTRRGWKGEWWGM